MYHKSIKVLILFFKIFNGCRFTFYDFTVGTVSREVPYFIPYIGYRMYFRLPFPRSVPFKSLSAHRTCLPASYRCCLCDILCDCEVP